MDQPNYDFKKIIARRDRRYDGRFYFGVKTTRIYCRPVCPARPHPENVVLFRSASEAEQAGYRACLRCTPDLAPGNKILNGTMNTVSRALKIISDTNHIEWTVDQLAHSLGMTDRHLRRLFQEHLGSSPLDVMITQRLHFAKQAIQQTSKPITEIAFASGFQSVRRFNEAFRGRFHRSPLEFRNNSQGASDSMSFRLPIRPPYDWDHMVNYLHRHSIQGIDGVRAGIYERFIAMNQSFGVVSVFKAQSDPFLMVTLNKIPLLEAKPILSRLTNLFDTDHNPAHLPRSPKIKARGIRVPGSFDPFETAVAIIIGQVVSTEHAKLFLKRLVERHGRYLGQHDSKSAFSFPTPLALTRLEAKHASLTASKTEAIRSLSRAVVQGEINFQSYLDFKTAREHLQRVKGIGTWTAHMIAMRCLGDTDAFPESDLIIKRAIDQRIIDPTDWTSLRSYLTHLLWRDHGKKLSKKRSSK